MDVHQNFWRVCSSCKKQLPYLGNYYECNVSTCSGKRTGFVFCSVLCWETHLPQARHRDAWAIEKKAPSLAQFKAESSGESVSAAAPPNPTPTRRIIVSSPSQTGPNLKTSANPSSMEHEVLVVVSKMKQYIKDKSDMNTSADVADILSEMIRRACDDAMDTARGDGRKTVMAKDFESK
jgi:hypothetical protein